MRSPLRILHLFANWKWTGPAEPAVLLAAEQGRRGQAVTLACGRPVAGCENEVAREARARGVEVHEGLRLSKHRRPVANLLDRGPLRALMRETRPDVVHVHQTNDHLLGGAAARRLRPGPRVLRSVYDGGLPRADGRSRRLFQRLTDGVIVFGRELESGFAARFPRSAARVVRTDPPVDLARFDPDRALPVLRGELGLEEGDVVIGLVARIQARRRFGLLFDAFALALREAPALRLLVVGRGTREEALARIPARDEAVRGRVIMAGYRRGDEYVGTLAALDAKIFLVPGTDGTCRAAREALAMGVPIVATRRGLLPEIVEDGVTGLLVDEEPEALAAALVRMARPDGLCERLGDRARSSARTRFDPARSADAAEDLARSLLVVT